MRQLSIPAISAATSGRFRVDSMSNVLDAPRLYQTGRRAALALLACGMSVFSTGTLAQYEATASAGNGQIGHSTTPGTVSYSYTHDEPSLGSNESAVVAFSASPGASVGAMMSAINPSGQIISGATGTMRYYFQVNALPFANVPVDFSGLFSSSSSRASAGYGAFTSFAIQTVNASVSTYASFASFFQGDCGAPICLQYTTHNAIYASSQTDISHVQGSFSGSFDMLTGADGSATGFVDLGAYASINSFFVAKSASAFIDPHIEIDAAFLAANPGAALTITPGVGNEISGVAAVPEPSTCALLIGGLGIVGAAVRRKARARH